MAKDKKDLESVTDYVEEKTLDQDKMNAAMGAMAKMKISDKKEDDRLKKLASLKISKEDIAVVTKEFGVDDKEAESALRENGGDLLKTLTALVRS